MSARRKELAFSWSYALFFIVACQFLVPDGMYLLRELHFDKWCLFWKVPGQKGETRALHPQKTDHRCWAAAYGGYRYTYM